MPARRRVQSIDDVGEVVGIGRGFRQQSIGRCRFIQRPRRQRLSDHAGAASDRPLKSLHHHVEVVEGTEFEQPHDADLGRSRIDVIKMLEAGRIFDVAEGRQRVPPGRFARRCLRDRRASARKAGRGSQRRRDGGEGAALQKLSSGNCQMKNSCRYGALVGAQYVARVRPIMLLFHHDTSL